MLLSSLLVQTEMNAARGLKDLFCNPRYWLTTPLELSRSDVTLSAYSGDVLPVISGARNVSSWRSEADGTWVAEWPGAANFTRLFSTAGDFANSRYPIDPSASLSWAAPLQPCAPTPGGGRPTCPDVNRLGFVYDPADLPDALLDAQPVTSLFVRVESAPFEETLHTVAAINRTNHTLLFGEPDAFTLGHYGSSVNRTRFSLQNVAPVAPDTWSHSSDRLHLRAGGS